PAVSAQGTDLSLRMAAQFLPHRARFQIQNLVHIPLDRHGRQRAAVRAVPEPGPAQRGQVSRRTEPQTLSLPVVAGNRAARQTGPTARQEPPGRAVGWGGATTLCYAALEANIVAPRGQRGYLPAAVQVPQTGAFVHAHGQQATVRADAAVDVIALV